MNTLSNYVLIMLILALFAPCLQASDPTCATGLISPGTFYCCARECGVCGGASCQDLPGGSNNCCTQPIEAQNIS